MTEWISNLPLTREISVGSIRIHAIESGIQWLDGGAMFGVVPKPLWQRRIPSDDQNRIPLALRCLVIESPDELVLVDTGILMHINGLALHGERKTYGKGQILLHRLLQQWQKVGQ